MALYGCAIEAFATTMREYRSEVEIDSYDLSISRVRYSIADASSIRVYYFEVSSRCVYGSCNRHIIVAYEGKARATSSAI